MKNEKTKGKSMRNLILVLGTLPMMFYFIQSWGLVPTIVFEVNLLFVSWVISSILTSKKS
tara:strand:+ start:4569 stop:4748 length:180 start_codon:yes stop_codon:yes gene_type:complete